jgi:hypothetical protein
MIQKVNHFKIPIQGVPKSLGGDEVIPYKNVPCKIDVWQVQNCVKMGESFVPMSKLFSQIPVS